MIVFARLSKDVARAVVPTLSAPFFSCNILGRLLRSEGVLGNARQHTRLLVIWAYIATLNVLKDRLIRLHLTFVGCDSSAIIFTTFIVVNHFLLFSLLS